MRYAEYFIVFSAQMDKNPERVKKALGVAINGFTPRVMLAVLTSSAVLSLAHRFSKKYLVELT